VTTGSIAARIERVRERIATACQRAGRAPDSVRLVAVAKTHPAELVRAAVLAGVADIGENYAQELAQKRQALLDLAGARWHFIGHLQRNKARLLVGHTHLVHAVDSEDLARELDRRAALAETVQDILLAINLSGEMSKSGVSAQAAPALLDLCEGLPHLRCRGLMTMPPLPGPGEAEKSRPFFRKLRELRDHLARVRPTLTELSMGMSADLEVAVEEGATLVRVGTDIFGPRSARD
jgi:pyridoxal phosphate enzyme (YggS family)